MKRIGKIGSYKFLLLLYIMLGAMSVWLTAQEGLCADVIGSSQNELYICFDKNLSDIAQVIGEISAIDSDLDSPVHILKMHIDNGYELGLRDEVISVLEYADWFVERYAQKDANCSLRISLDRVIDQVLNGELDISKEGIVRSSDLQLTVESKVRFKESVCLDKRLSVQGEAHFDDDVEFKDNVKIKKDLFVKGGIRVEDDLSTQDIIIVGATIANLSVTDTLTAQNFSVFDQTVSGTLSVNEAVIGCGLGVGCNIDMKNTTSSSVGNINKNGSRFIHNFGQENSFIGVNAGNFAIPASNTAIGFSSLQGNTLGIKNVAIGASSMLAEPGSAQSVAVGYEAVKGSNGFSSVAFGSQALPLSGGAGNVAIGFQAGLLSSSLQGSILIGSFVASNVTGTNNNNNILIGSFVGQALDINVIRIGNTQEKTFMAGVFGQGAGGSAVFINSNGQLGTMTSSKRFKHSIENIDNESARVYGLNPVSFVYNEDAEGAKQYGLIAEEVAKVFPELVVSDKDGEPVSVHYEVLPVLILNEIQKLSQELKTMNEDFIVIKQQAEEFMARS